MQEKEQIEELNKKLFNWANKEKKNNLTYTNPYLIIPEDTYWNKKIKILILGKETNGWGENENFTKQDELQKLYIDKINDKGFSKGYGHFWNFYFNYIKNIEENNHNVGICVSNIALLGFTYDKKGYNTGLAKKLSYYLKKYLELLKPDIIVCFAGFGTKTHQENNYVLILKEIFGDYKGNTPISPDRNIRFPLLKLSFDKLPNKIELYGSAHPERKSIKWKEMIKNTLEYILQQKKG